MSLVTATPRGDSDGSIVRQFIDVVDSTQKTFSYDTEQEHLKIKNKGYVPVVFSAGTYSNITIQPLETWENDVIFTSFILKTSSGITEIEATSKEYDNKLVNKSEFNSYTKQITPLQGLVISESILDMGTPGFVTQIQNSLGANILDGTYGGSCIGTQLAELCDEAYVHMVGENALKYSNDLTQADWTLLGYTASKTNLKDGRDWNLVTKNDDTSGKCIRQSLTQPAAITGIFMSFEAYIPINSTVQSVSINIANNTRSLTIFHDVDVVSGKYYKIGYWKPISSLATWASGDSIRAQIMINSLYSNVAGVCYIRNIEFSFFSPFGYENHMPTLATAVAAGTSTLTKIELPNFNYKDLDFIIQQNGRNDSAYMDRYCYMRALDKVIAQCVRKASAVIISNCPPHKTGTAWSQNGNDGYYTISAQPLFKRLMAKWNIGFDMYQKFLDLTATGVYTVSDLMQDSVHPSDLAVSNVLVPAYVKDITQRRLINNALPEMSGIVKYYKSGTMIGTWSFASESSTIESRLTGSSGIPMTSSTVNDTILFSGITGEQLHLIIREDETYGTVNVIIDEGTNKQRIIPIDISAVGASNRTVARFICDYLDSGTHTVKIKVTSTAKTVKIFGIVVI